jgi:hypothetical protein
MLDPVSKFVQVRYPLTAIALEVIGLEKMVDCRHIIGEIANSSKPGDTGNERCSINDHIVLVTWNDVYI